MRHADYLIVGGGLAGSTCAYLLKQAGCDVMLVERLDVETKSSSAPVLSRHVPCAN